MQIDGYNALYGLANLIAGGTSANSGTALPAETQFDPARVVLGDAFARATDAGEALTELDQLISAAKPGRTRRALAASANPLSLAATGGLTSTTLRSSEEVNATPTSFSLFGPAYDLPTTSVALPTITGIYNGDNGNMAITFQSRTDGEHTDAPNTGSTIRFRLNDEDGVRLRDPNGDRYPIIRIRRQDPIGQEYAVGNGLILTLGEGVVTDRDEFTVNVFADVGSVVDPNKPLNGVRNDNPNLEYGLAVTEGSFFVNGIEIAVNADDSINDVLARITASAAGVTAVFDVATEQVILTRNTPGSAYDITLVENDSGFLAATKLDNAVRELGTDGSPITLLSELPQFAAVTSGTFRVNNVDIALDVEADSLEDVLARIDASGANVRTSIINDRVFFEARHRKDSMILEDGGTGLFDALYIREGRYKPVNRDGIDLASASAIATSVGRATAAVERLVDGNYGAGGVPGEVSQLQTQARGILAAAGEDLLDNSQPRFGVDLDLSEITRPALNLVDVTELVTSLRVDFSEFKATFIGAEPDARDGFVRQLLDVVNQFTEALRREAGVDGFLAGLSA